MATVSLTRKEPAKPLISLVPMIDVMLILLVFFMVTSTYLDLDMIPVVDRGDDVVPTAGQSVVSPDGNRTLFVRLGADGLPAIAGRPLDMNALSATIRERLATEPALQILILPSGASDLQSLVTVLDTATAAGVTRLRVLRLEAAE